MAEHDRDRIASINPANQRDRVDEAQDAVGERNIVRDGGIARSDADIEDVTRDTYGSPGDRDEPTRDVSDIDQPVAGQVLGISRDVPRDADVDVAPASDADRRCRRALLEEWVGRESASFRLPPSRLAIDPGDVVQLDHDGRLAALRVTSVADAGARVVEAVKVIADCFEKLATNSVVDRKLRIELQRPVKANSARRSEANIWRAQNQLVNRHQPRAHVIFCIRLLQMKFLQFLDLQNLSE